MFRSTKKFVGYRSRSRRSQGLFTVVLRLDETNLKWAMIVGSLFEQAKYFQMIRRDSVPVGIAASFSLAIAVPRTHPRRGNALD